MGKWHVPGQNLKLKFLLMVDMATKYKVVDTLFVYSQNETRKIENGDMIIKSVVMKWLMDKPRTSIDFGA